MSSINIVNKLKKFSKPLAQGLEPTFSNCNRCENTNPRSSWRSRLNIFYVCYLKFIKKLKLHGGDLNPNRPRDGRIYQALYYRGPANKFDVRELMFVYTVFDVLRRTYVVQMLYSPSLGDCVIFKGLTKPLSISELVD